MKPDFSAAARFCAGESTTAYELFGCHPLGDGLCRFAVYAPSAAAVALAGDFNSWQPAPMAQADSGLWCCTAAAAPGDVYKYAVTDRQGNTVLKSDPFAFFWETAPANGSRVPPRLDGYAWQDGAWLARRGDADPVSSPISIYELHLGSWRLPQNGSAPNYRDTAAELAAYCAEMGYTHVELLPITEHPYTPSWGYQVCGYFAPTSRFGSPVDFMAFVDTLHCAGIGVLLDWVPAHFPRDTFGLARFDGTALYERDDPKMASHPDWGTLIFDYAKPAVRSFLKSSAAFWLDQYHIDGLRLDAVSSMLYRGFGRNGDYVPHPLGGDVDLDAVSLLREITGLTAARGCISIAEESSAFPGVTAPAKDGGLGFTFKWDMGFMHDTLDYMALDPLWRRGSHGKLSFSMMYAFSEHFVLAYSHDEVVHGKKSMLDKMSGSYDDKFAGLRTLYGFQFGHPGKKLTFMGSDFAQFIEWDFQKELDWFLLDYPRHAEMQRWVKMLNRLYRAHSALWAVDDSWDGFRWLNVDDADRSCIAFLRTDGAGDTLVCACNFTPKTWELQIALPGAGRLTRLLSGDEYRFGGTGTVLPETVESAALPFLDAPCSAMLMLPPLSCSYYQFEEDPTDEP